MNARIQRWLPWFAFATLLLITAAVYAPGLYGDFVYDDVSFVSGNTRVQVTTLDLGDWVAAALSFPAGTHQGRWLCMLSFAANHYFTGLDPFWFKLTNLGIHLLNGIFLALALKALFVLWRECRSGNSTDRNLDWTAVAIAGLWLVLPINLTAVLYVSQRLESLSNTFVFLGLWWYLRARVGYWKGEHGPATLWLALIASTGMGLLVKESAVLLPLYALCVEITITRVRSRTGNVDRGILWLYGCLLMLPLVGGLIWLGGWAMKPGAYERTFTTFERVQTEFRVLVDYIRWTLAPNLDSLTLYHDDVQVSRGWLDPPATLAAFAGLLAMLAGALWQLHRRPLFSLGVFWFFSGHLLTATIIPLLLAFEHRNYFPSVGLLLAVASLATIEGGLQKARVRGTLAVVLFAFYAFTTWMRAEEWSDGSRLAMSEASKRPDSPIAQYERARVLIGSRGPNGAPLIEDGFLVLEDASHLPNSGIRFEQILITMHAGMGGDVNPAWMRSLIAKLKSGPATPSDARALANLNKCYIDKKCKGDVAELGEAYAAALNHPLPSPALLSVHAEYSWYLQNDRVTAEQDIREAVRRAPLDFEARKNLIILLLATGKLDEGRAEIATIQKMNYFGMFDKLLQPLEAALKEKASTNPST